MRSFLSIVLLAALSLPSFAQKSLRTRREWYDRQPNPMFPNNKLTLVRSTLAPQERKAYTDAVTCLMKLPSVLDSEYKSPSHFDDFLAVHINHTWHVHLNGYFLAWHRAYVRIYEDALQMKCGYEGMQPCMCFDRSMADNSRLGLAEIL